MGCLPSLGRNDLKFGSFKTKPLSFRASAKFLRPTPHDLLTLAPDDLTLVERAVEHLSDGRGCPPVGVTRRLHAIGIECLCDPGRAQTLGAHIKNSAHDGRLLWIDPSNDMQALTFEGEYLDVVVAINLAARNVQSPSLPGHDIVRPLAALLTLHLGRERAERQHYLVEGSIKRAFAVLEIEEDTDARVGDLFQ